MTTSRQGRPLSQPMRDRIVRLVTDQGDQRDAVRVVAERLGLNPKLVSRVVREAREKGGAT